MLSDLQRLIALVSSEWEGRNQNGGKERGRTSLAALDCGKAWMTAIRISGNLSSVSASSGASHW